MIINNFDKNKIFNRRLFLLISIKLFFISCLTIRLFYLQIFKNKKYATLADSNRIKSFIIPPLRGKILDRHGKTLATNSSYYRILLNNTPNLDLNKVLNQLSKIIDIPRKNFLYNKKSLRKSSEGALLIYDDLSFEQISKVEVHSPDLPGIYIETAQRRFYPFSDITSNILGYVASVSEKESALSNNALLKHPDFKIGKIGVEKTYENSLRGDAGIAHVEVDAYGFAIRNTSLPSSKEMHSGEDMQLSIDVELQEYTYNLVKDKRASVVLLDIKTGEVLSMVSSPNFNPNLFLSGMNTEEWGSLVNNLGKPLTNKAISSQYPPGSTFKIMVALAALENGYNPNKKLFCSGKVRLGRRWFHCWRKEGHGSVNLVEAIERSCNGYFYQMSRDVGIYNIVKAAKDFGLGAKTTDEFYNEKPGNLPSKKWKKKVFNVPWVLGDTYNSAIGQGFIETTTMQLAVMTARLASKGKKIIPTLHKLDTQPIFEELSYDKKNIDLIQRGMFNVVNKKTGTAYWQKLRSKKFQMAGKTGTSQVVAIDHKLKTKKEIEFEKRNHGLFIGFAPFDDPKYAISVVVEHGGSGSGSAAPIARRLLNKIHRDLKKKAKEKA